MTRCESYPPCFGTIYFPTAPLFLINHSILFCLEKPEGEVIAASPSSLRTIE